ncbi:hypothetical protein IC617_16260 [Neiella sp. HB171785]|uniref:Uncharacterized protein n=1 Tax=Neiella litorisoli TaxID=2771431 RepID=A0A8J6QKG6_9GAMM|nr:hypothetical protein [Neiella litorisoli]MBD1390983.1 hypothetical protein [Neiella litorisoli]
MTPTLIHKYQKPTAVILLLWFVVCLGFVCTQSNQVKAEVQVSPQHHLHHQQAAESTFHQSSAPHHSTAMAQDPAHCADKADQPMTKLLTSHGAAFISLMLAALALWSSQSLMLVMNAMLSFYRGKPETEPPNSGYPPLFITTQRLLN